MMSTADSSDQQSSKLDDGAAAAAELGERLQNARNARGLSERDLARQINLTASTVSRIETGHWDQLGAPVYLRGYLDALSRLLEVDCSIAEAYFTSRERAAQEAARSEFLVSPKPSALQHSHRLLAYVAATALLAIPATWLIMGAFKGEIGAPSPATVAARTAPEASATDGVSADDAGTTTAETRIEPRLASIAPLPELLRDNAITTPTPMKPLPVLRLDFGEEAWLEVNDASGKRLAFGLMAAGSSRSFETEQGLIVRLGNADAVTAFLDDAVYALDAHRTGEIAEFSLPAN
ncbi:MAG: RodZ domain-containing protein [Pseudomonadota bacterium]